MDRGFSLFRFTRHLNRRHAAWLVGTTFALLALTTLTGLHVYAEPIQLTGPEETIRLDQPITLSFTHPVTRTNLDPTIEPDVPGEWRYEQFLFQNHLPRAITFYPLVNYLPATKYTISMNRIVPGEAAPISQIMTTDLAIVQTVEPQTESLVGQMPTIRVNLSHTARVGSRFRLTSNPEIAWSMTPVADEILEFQPTEGLSQGVTYHVTLHRLGVQEDLTDQTIIEEMTDEMVWLGTYHVPPPPELAEATPAGTQARPQEPIDLTFTEAIEPTSLTFSQIAIEPAHEGSWTWLAPAKLVFSPAGPWQLQTSYRVILPAGIATATGSRLNQPIIHSFTTIGPVAVSSLSPSRGATGVNLDRPFIVQYNQDILREQTISVTFSPDIAGKTTWIGRTLTFTPAGRWQANTTYTAFLPAGIQGTISSPSSATTSTFTTVYATTEVVTPLYYQAHDLSCEAAALRMALAAKGAFVSEQTLIDAIGVDPTPHANGIWGDPYQAFVGALNGKQMIDGYGVYWEPVARVAIRWRPSEAFSDWNLETLLGEIDRGHPIVVWGYYGSGRIQTWQTPTGKTITGITGEHARVVTGYVGPRAQPTWILLNDPIAGKIRWRPTQFLANWQALRSSGVVVR